MFIMLYNFTRKSFNPHQNLMNYHILQRRKWGLEKIDDFSITKSYHYNCIMNVLVAGFYTFGFTEGIIPNKYCYFIPEHTNSEVWRVFFYVMPIFQGIINISHNMIFRCTTKWFVYICIYCEMMTAVSLANTHHHTYLCS